MFILNNVSIQKISILPSLKGLGIPRRRGVTKTQNFKAMYEAKFEFPEGWGVIGQIPSLEGIDIFWKYTILMNTNCDTELKFNSALSTPTVSDST